MKKEQLCSQKCGHTQKPDHKERQLRKSDAEEGIRFLCTTYAEAHSIPLDGTGDPSFGDFYRWLRENHSAYLSFRTTGSVADQIERWWAEEFKQTWRY